MSIKYLILFALIFISACASVTKQRVALQAAAHAETILITKPISLHLDTGYKRDIKPDSRWSYVGDIVKGKVYKPVDDVFSIEGTQRYEAYLVISKGRVVGFYLPASSNFSPLTDQVALP